MEFWIYVVLSGVVGITIAGAWWMRRPRRVYVTDHIRAEMHPAHVVADHMVEVVWRAAMSMTNVSRRPRMLPVFAERATVKAGWREYRARVYLDAEMVEVNPGDTALAWVELVLPVGSVPERIDLLRFQPGKDCRRVRWSVRYGALKPRTSVAPQSFLWPCDPLGLQYCSSTGKEESCSVGDSDPVTH